MKLCGWRYFSAVTWYSSTKELELDTIVEESGKGYKNEDESGGPGMVHSETKIEDDIVESQQQHQQQKPEQPQLSGRARHGLRDHMAGKQPAVVRSRARSETTSSLTVLSSTNNQGSALSSIMTEAWKQQQHWKRARVPAIAWRGKWHYPCRRGWQGCFSQSLQMKLRQELRR